MKIYIFLYTQLYICVRVCGAQLPSFAQLCLSNEPAQPATKYAPPPHFNQLPNVKLCAFAYPIACAWAV